jgi:hypothetical protein
VLERLATKPGRRAAESNRVRGVLQTPADHQIDTSGCARPELNQAFLSGAQACSRYISGARNGCECPGTIRIRRFGRPQCCRLHLTRRELASGVEPARSVIPGRAPSNGGQHGWSHWVTLPVVLLARQNSSLLRLTPERARKDSNLLGRIWNPFCDLRADPRRLVGKSNPSPPLDRRVSTPADSRGIDVSLLGAYGATCSAQSADEAGLTNRDRSCSRRESNARRFCLGGSAPEPRARAWGDVRVSIPSGMHSQCTGFASSLTSQSSWLESNQHPSCSQGTCPATRLQLEKWITPVTIRALPLFRRPLSPEQLAIRE